MDCTDIQDTTVKFVPNGSFLSLAKEAKQNNLTPVRASYDTWYDVWVIDLQKPITPVLFKQHNHG